MAVSILHIRSGFLVGGPEKLIFSGITGMDPQRYTFTLASFVLPGRENFFLNTASNFGISIRPINISGSFDLSAVSQIRALLEEVRPQLIVSHDYRALAFALWARRGNFIPLVAVAHGWTSQTLKVRFYEYIESKLLRKAEGVAAVSKPKYVELAGLGISDSKLRLIENGVNIPTRDLLVRQQKLKCDLGLTANHVLVGVVGRLSVEKGHRFLIEAAAQLRSAFPDARYALIGDGPLKDQLKRLAAERGVDQIVTFAGWRSDMESVYRGLDIFALPSLTEGLPMALLEAMSYSVPSIASRVGGCPDVIASDKIGRLCAPGDVSSLVAALSSFFESAELRNQVGIAGYERVGEKYSVHRYVEEFARLYSDVIQGTVS